jgi:kumamolisin
MRPRALVAIAAGVVLVLVSPPGLAVHPGAPRGDGAAAAPSLTTDAVPVPPGSAVALQAPDTPVGLAFTLAFANASVLASRLNAIEDPGSPEYDHYLSYPEFVREFGPAPGTVREVERALVSGGATSVTVGAGGLAIDANLTAAEASELLGVTFVRYVSPTGAVGTTVEGTPSLPAGLRGAVVGVDGLASSGAASALEATLSAEPTAPSLYVQDGPSGPDWYFGSDYTQAYGAVSLLPGGSGSVANATYPQRVAVATLLASGYNTTTRAVLPPWDPSVIDDYFNATFPSGWPLPNLTGVPVNAAGAKAPLPGSFHGQNDSTGFEIENSLDLEMAGSLAPGAALYNFYFSGELAENPQTWDDLTSYLADDLGAALAYNYTPATLAVVSCSFGEDDLNNTQWDAELTEASAMGVTVVAASGDQGDAPSQLTGRTDNQWPLWPATASFNASGAVAVGGASVALAGSPTATYSGAALSASYDPNVEGIANSSAWWDSLGGPGDLAGTEGGTSQVYPEPEWQFDSAAQPAIVAATEIEGFGRLGRAEPDLAFPANSTIAFVSAAANGTPYFAVLAGTSIAAPVLAGLLADVVAVRSVGAPNVTALGFLDPELYRMASYYAANPSASDPFLPVDYGGNALFSAAPGWNPTAGWGGLYAPLFLAALGNSTVADYRYTGPTPLLPGTTPTPTSLETVLIVLGAAALVVVAVVALLSRRSRPRPMPVRAGYPYPAVWPPPPVGTGGPYATFSCPYCGLARPSEAGHCPHCGAM